MNIIVTGCGGQLGSEFRASAQAYPEHSIHCYTHQQLDISSASQLGSAIREHACNVLVNCAAFTSVDKAEADASVSFAVNRDAVRTLAGCAREFGLLLIHFSTYNVFDGMSPFPYAETAVPAPHGVNAMAKLAGEELVRQIAPSYLIFRIGWLYGPFGDNFVRTMLRLGRQRESVSVVSDRVGSPAYSADVVAAVMGILAKAEVPGSYGATYHFCNEGVCSWYDMAVAIMERASLACRVVPVASSAFPVSGPRPWYSVLDNNAVKRDWGLEIPYWRSSLFRALDRM